jgi:hypothetical protein
VTAATGVEVKAGASVADRGVDVASGAGADVASGAGADVASGAGADVASGAGVEVADAPQANRKVKIPAIITNRNRGSVYEKSLFISTLPTSLLKLEETEFRP